MLSHTDTLSQAVMLLHQMVLTSTSRYPDDLLNVDSNFFDSMVNRIYPSELRLNKAYLSDAETSFLDLHLSISDCFVKTKMYDKRDYFLILML